MTPAAYALTALKADRFPQINIYSVAGDFWLADNEWKLLKGHSYKTRTEAERVRSKALDAASRRFWRVAA